MNGNLNEQYEGYAVYLPLLQASNTNLLFQTTYNSDRKSWKIAGWTLPQDIRIARNEKQLDFPFASPLAKYMLVNDLMAHDIDVSDYYKDTWAKYILVNHNIYTYHRYSIDACDLVFSKTKKNHTRVPTEILEMAELIERYFTAE